MKVESPRESWRVVQFLVVVACWILKLLNALYTSIVPDLHATNEAIGLSGRIDDPSWMPPGTELEQVAVWGRHFFGDLQIFFGYAESSNPYDPNLAVPSQTPPLVIQIFDLVNFNRLFALIAVVAFWLLIPLIGILRWRGSRSLSELAILYLISTILPVWAFVSFDRGNTLPIAAGLLLIGLSGIEREKDLSWKSVLCIAVSISFKPHLAVILIYLLITRRVRQVALTVLYFVSINTILFLKFYPNPFRGWLSWSNTLLTYQDPDVVLRFSYFNVMSLFGLLQKLRFDVLDMTLDTEGLLSTILGWRYLSFGILFVLILLIGAISLMNQVQGWIQITLWLAVSQLGVAATGTYGSAWLIASLPLVGVRFFYEPISKGSANQTAFHLICAASLASMLPFTVHRILSPIAWLIVIVVTFGQSLRSYVQQKGVVTR
jgi:hypothetical protein